VKRNILAALRIWTLRKKPRGCTYVKAFGRTKKSIANATDFVRAHPRIVSQKMKIMPDILCAGPGTRVRVRLLICLQRCQSCASASPCTRLWLPAHGKMPKSLT